MIEDEEGEVNQKATFNQNWCHATAEKSRSKQHMELDFRREKMNDGGEFFVLEEDEAAVVTLTDEEKAKKKENQPEFTYRPFYKHI